VKALIKLLGNILQKIRFGQVSKPQPFDCDNQDAETWKERARQAARLWLEALTEDDAWKEKLCVADFGCGDQKLKLVLAASAGPQIEYFGYDLHPQSNEVGFCDFEKTIPAGPFDAIFCLGLLEYVRDVDHLLCQMRRVCRYAVVSFVVTSRENFSKADLKNKGWISQYSKDELSEKLIACGFKIRKMVQINDDTTTLWLLKVDSPLVA
jgi:ubiquinone/menaquinone biosynthesis C-methylase UbiE